MKTCKCLVILLMVTGTCSWAQETTKVDSLKKQLSGKPDRESYPILWGLAWELFDVENEEALFYAKRAHEVALQKGDTLEIVKSGRILGQLLRRVDKINASIEVLSKVLPIAERHALRKELKSILNALALSYTYTPYKETALQLNMRSLSLRLEDGEDSEIATALNNIGLLYYQLGLFRMALDYYYQAMNADKANVSSNEMYLMNIGLAYIHLDDTANGRSYLEAALAKCSPNCRQQITTDIEYGFGYLALKKGEYALAERHFQNSLEFGEGRYFLLSKIGLLRTAIGTGHLKVAEKLFHELHSLRPSNENEETGLELPIAIAEYFIAIKNFENASRYLLEQKALEKIRTSESTIKSLASLQTYFAEQENIRRIEVQSKILSLQEEAILLHKRLNIVTSILVILAVALIGLLVRNLRRKQKINLLLDLKVRERTMELENSYETLNHSHNEQIVVLNNLRSRVVALQATWRGLANIVHTDCERMHECYHKADETITELRKMVDRYVSKG